MSPMKNAGEAVVEMLWQEGVSHIFGIVGPSFLDIPDQSTIEMTLSSSLLGAALMADGFSRLSGKPSACLFTHGPSVLNLT